MIGLKKESSDRRIEISIDNTMVSNEFITIKKIGSLSLIITWQALELEEHGEFQYKYQDLRGSLRLHFLGCIMVVASSQSVLRISDLGVSN